MGILDRTYALYAPDPALPFRFYVVVPDTNGLYNCVVEQVQATFRKIPAKPRFSAGSNDYYPDNNDIDGLSITFYETFDYRVSAWLSRWREKVVRADGSYGLPTEYKKDITVYAYNYNSESPVLTIVYKDCWPTDQSPFAFSYDNVEGRLMVEAQFSVDSAELK